MTEQRLGILGGMGPQATQDFYQRILDRTDASCDQEHLPTLIWSDTSMPDRTAAILGGDAEGCYRRLLEGARLLERGGCTVLAIPCNTSHYFADRLQGEISIPLIHMPRETVGVLAAAGQKKVGILATDGTVQTGIYQRTFAGTGIGLLTPEPEGQAAIMAMIYQGVKAGDLHYDVAAARRAMEALLERGAQTLILGCTELPLAAQLYRLDYPFTDPTLELARGAIRFAGGETTD